MVAVLAVRFNPHLGPFAIVADVGSHPRVVDDRVVRPRVWAREWPGQIESASHCVRVSIKTSMAPFQGETK